MAESKIEVFILQLLSLLDHYLHDVYGMVHCWCWDWSHHLKRNLWIYNLFVIPIVFVYMSAQSLCDDRKDGTIREMVLQGINRRTIHLGKLLTFAIIIGVAHLLLMIPSILLTTYNNCELTLVGYGLSWMLGMLLWYLTQYLSFRTTSSGTVTLIYVQWLMLENLVKMGLWIAPTLSKTQYGQC